MYQSNVLFFEKHTRIQLVEQYISNSITVERLAQIFSELSVHLLFIIIENLTPITKHHVTV